MTKIRVFLRGGLGNQFFQWLHATSLVMTTPSCEAVLDTTFLRKRRNNQASGRLELEEIFTDLVHQVGYLPVPVALEPLLSRSTRLLGLTATDVNAENLWWANRPKPFFYGYYQRPPIGGQRVLQRARSLLKPSLTAPPLHSSYLAIHIRAGDYGKVRYNREMIGMLAEDYYTNAAAALASSVPNTRIIVISDDAAAAAGLLPRLSAAAGGVPVETLDHLLGRPNRPDDALRFLLNAAALATANSSFSAMAAYLGGATYIVSPQPWFRGDALAHLDPSLPNWDRRRSVFRSPYEQACL